MMINKRLIALVANAKKYIAGIVGVQWLSLLANIVMIFCLANLLEALFVEAPSQQALLATLAVFAAAAIIRAVCTIIGSKISHLASVQVKLTLRTRIYQKILALGSGYTQEVRTSEIVQVAGEGIEQLDIYFGRYLPQLFYGVLAPLTLFCALAFVNLLAAIVLLVATPLILVAIMAVSRFARRLFAKYWREYTDLGANFLENLQGLTTLKIYQASDRKREEMASDAESFRKVTMKVLTGQLGSIAAMDFVAFGGAALGIIIALFQFQALAVSLAGCLAIILLSAEFFIPMRQLGSLFHVAMNGVTASDRIFSLLDLAQTRTGQESIAGDVQTMGATLQRLTYAYDDKPVLSDVSIDIPPVGLTSIVGKSGCGKSTLAQVLMGSLGDYTGSVKLQANSHTTVAHEICDLSEKSLMANITLVSSNCHIFKGTVRENLLIARPDANDQILWDVLAKVKLDAFLNCEAGLDTQINEGAANFSGGQKQRLALARALLHDTALYIFDEATSNIDVESEHSIMEVIHELAESKAVLLISHRLLNVVNSQNIYVLDNSTVVEQGRHHELLAANRYYASLFNAQNDLENFADGTAGARRTGTEKTGQVPHNPSALQEVKACV